MGGTTFSLNFKSKNWFLDSGLISISTNSSVVEMWETQKFFLWTWSQTKWKSSSRCLEWAWKIGLAARYIAKTLSHQMRGMEGTGCLSSRRRHCDQDTSNADVAKA